MLALGIHQSPSQLGSVAWHEGRIKATVGGATFHVDSAPSASEGVGFLSGAANSL